MRRVVVTGLGMVSPFGRGVDFNWKNILDGKSGIRKIDNIDLKDIPCQIAGQVPFGKEENQFDPDTVMAPKDQKKVDKFILTAWPQAVTQLKIPAGNRRPTKTSSVPAL